MAADGLKTLFVSFAGDTGKINYFVKHFKGFDGLGKALKAAKWSVADLEKEIVQGRAKAAKQVEDSISKDADKRRLAAAEEAKTLIKDRKIGNGDVRKLLLEWLILEKEYLARDLSQPNHTPDLSYLEMSGPAKMGAAKVRGEGQLTNQLLDQEPVVAMSKRVAEFRRKLSDMAGKLEDSKSSKDKEALDQVREMDGWADRMAKELSAAYQRGAPKPKEMEFKEQYMVPSAKDLDAVDQRQGATKGIQTPDQAWALEGAEMKGKDQLALSRLQALERLELLGKQWGTGYGEKDLDAILKKLAGGKLVTNYRLAEAPGKQQEGAVQIDKQVTLAELLRKNKNFKNVWETGTSQASADLNSRGGVEEQMGYSQALGRTGGEAHSIDQGKDNQSNFRLAKEGTDKQKGEMPKYAALVSENVRDGVSPRYGDCFVIWKEEVRQRVTHTAGDSWNTMGAGVESFTSNSNPEILLAKGDELLIRIAAAEATGKDKKFLKEVEAGNVNPYSYIETQVHGDLTWDDVDTLVLGGKDAPQLDSDFQAFRKEKGYTFKIKLK